MPATAATSLAWPCPAKRKQAAFNRWSGNLGDARGLHHRRTALPLGEARSFFLVRVDPPEFFAVGVIDTDEIMVMLAAAVLRKGTFSSSRTLLRPTFCHVDHPCFSRVSIALSQGSKRRASTGGDSNPRSITAEKRAGWNGKTCQTAASAPSPETDTLYFYYYSDSDPRFKL